MKLHFFILVGKRFLCSASKKNRLLSNLQADLCLLFTLWSLSDILLFLIKAFPNGVALEQVDWSSFNMMKYKKQIRLYIFLFKLLLFPQIFKWRAYAFCIFTK